MDKFVKRTAVPAKKKEQSCQERKQEEKSDAPGALAACFLPLASKNSSPTLLDEKADIIKRLFADIYDGNSDAVFRVLSRNRPFEKDSLKKRMEQISFGTDFSTSDSEFFLLQADENTVAKFLADQQSLTLRGDNDDEMVLCTEMETFPVKMIETSSTVFLLSDVLENPDVDENAETSFASHQLFWIRGRSFATMELCAPVDHLNVGKLKDMLREQELKWDWRTSETDRRVGHSLDDLLDVVQMSVGEIRRALEDLPVVQLNERLRYLSHNYRGEFFGCLVDLLDDDDHPDIQLGQVGFDSLRAGLPSNVPDSVIRWFLTQRCDPISDEGFRLEIPPLIRDLATIVMHSTKRLPLTSFEEIIAKVLPFGVAFEPTCLEGVCDVVDTPGGKSIIYLHPEDLPDRLEERMVYLFAQRKFWTMEELRPYFGDLFKERTAFDKFLVQKCDYTLGNENEIFYCGVRSTD